eukprot:670984-Rhodomonas_salina.2
MCVVCVCVCLVCVYKGVGERSPSAGSACPREPSLSPTTGSTIPNQYRPWRSPTLCQYRTPHSSVRCQYPGSVPDTA